MPTYFLYVLWIQSVRTKSLHRDCFCPLSMLCRVLRCLRRLPGTTLNIADKPINLEFFINFPKTRHFIVHLSFKSIRFRLIKYITQKQTIEGQNVWDTFLNITKCAFIVASKNHLKPWTTTNNSHWNQYLPDDVLYTCVYAAQQSRLTNY